MKGDAQVDLTLNGVQITGNRDAVVELAKTAIGRL